MACIRCAQLTSVVRNNRGNDDGRERRTNPPRFSVETNNKQHPATNTWQSYPEEGGPISSGEYDGEREETAWLKSRRWGGEEGRQDDVPNEMVERRAGHRTTTTMAATLTRLEMSRQSGTDTANIRPLSDENTRRAADDAFGRYAIIRAIVTYAIDRSGPLGREHRRYYVTIKFEQCSMLLRYTVGNKE